MTFHSEPYSSRRDTIAFLVCLLLAVVARVSPPESTEAVASLMRQTVLVPLIALQTQTELVRARRADFARIQSERDSAIAMTGFVTALQNENARLRTMLDLRSRMPIAHVAGEVLHQARPTDAFSLLISSGREDGVRRWAPVIVPAGLVGNIQQVDAATSVAMAWTDPEFRVSASALNGSVVGIVAPRAGDGPTILMELREVAYGQVVPSGTTVFTSGLGGVYPRGIPIGRVLGVSDEREGWSRNYLLEPAVHPAAVSHVLILLAEVADLAPVFGIGR